MSGVILVLSLLIPPLGIPFGLYGLSKDFDYWRYYVFCIALGIASFAYSYIPLENTDLVRYAISFDEIAKKPFLEAVFETGELANGGTSNLYIANLFGWVFGRFGNYHHATAFTTFVIYCIGMHITCSLAERMIIREEDTVFYIILLIVSLSFYGIINNIRNIFSFSMISLAVYRDCVEHKRNIPTLLLYIIPCFIHSSSVAIIILRFLAMLKGILRYAAFAIVSVSNKLIELLYTNISLLNSFGSIGNYIKYMVTKAYYYFVDTDSAWGLVVRQSGSKRLTSIIYLTLASIICIMFLWFLFDKRKKKDTSECRSYDTFFTYSWLNLAFVISCMTMLIYTNYWRYESNFLLTAGGIVFYSLAQTKNETKGSKYIKSTYRISIYKPLLLIPAIGCMVMWMRDFIPNSDQMNLVVGSIFSSPFIVIARQLLGV